ncbi:hypothetical protein QL285_026650 [Trifolium repens]|nr:hypothetical protein QL285_026650 [Trifolium repens]
MAALNDRILIKEILVCCLLKLGDTWLIKLRKFGLKLFLDSESLPDIQCQSITVMHCTFQYHGTLAFLSCVIQLTPVTPFVTVPIYTYKILFNDCP